MRVRPLIASRKRFRILTKIKVFRHNKNNIHTKKHTEQKLKGKIVLLLILLLHFFILKRSNSQLKSGIFWLILRSLLQLAEDLGLANHSLLSFLTILEIINSHLTNSSNSQ